MGAPSRAILDAVLAAAKGGPTPCKVSGNNYFLFLSGCSHFFLFIFFFFVLISVCNLFAIVLSCLIVLSLMGPIGQVSHIRVIGVTYT